MFSDIGTPFGLVRLGHRVETGGYTSDTGGYTSDTGT